MDAHDEEMRSIIAKCDRFKKEVDKFTASLSENLNTYCATNDMMIDALYKGTSLEREYKRTNSAIRLSMVMLISALNDSKKMADIGSVMKATLEKTCLEDNNNED